MKKLLFLFLALLAIGGLFQACDNSKTYAEQLEEEKDAVNKFIKDHDFRIISKEEFEQDTITLSRENGDSYDEFVAFSNGVYFQIVDRGSKNAVDTFANNDYICARYVEQNIASRDTTCFNVFLPAYADLTQLYQDPATFRYVSETTNIYGVFVEMDYYWASAYGTTAVPSGWLLALPYVRNNAHVRLIVPSKMGHSGAQQSVIPFFYDIWEFEKSKS